MAGAEPPGPQRHVPSLLSLTRFGTFPGSSIQGHLPFPNPAVPQDSQCCCLKPALAPYELQSMHLDSSSVAKPARAPDLGRAVSRLRERKLHRRPATPYPPPPGAPSKQGCRTHQDRPRQHPLSHCLADEDLELIVSHTVESREASASDNLAL